MYTMKIHAFQHSYSVRTALCLAVAFVLMLGCAQAGEPNPKKPAPSGAKKKSEKERVIITGSNIPQKADRLGRITTHSPVVIIDQRAIERTGRVTVIGLLSTQPYVR